MCASILLDAHLFAVWHVDEKRCLLANYNYTLAYAKTAYALPTVPAITDQGMASSHVFRAELHDDSRRKTLNQVSPNSAQRFEKKTSALDLRKSLTRGLKDF